MLYNDQRPTLEKIISLYGFDIWEPMECWNEDTFESVYPIWDEEKREWLNHMILDHFRFREIAQPTPQQHIFYLHRTMREMMPTLNPIFKALDQEHDILKGYEATDVTNGLNNSDVETTTHSTNRQVYSATPQTQLSGDENYATNLTDVGADQDGTSKQQSMSSGTAVHSGRSDSVVDRATNWASGVNNALYLVYNGLEPLYQQVWPDYPEVARY